MSEIPPQDGSVTAIHMKENICHIDLQF